MVIALVGSINFILNYIKSWITECLHNVSKKLLASFWIIGKKALDEILLIEEEKKNNQKMVKSVMVSVIEMAKI